MNTQLRLARGRQFSTNTSIRPKTRIPVRAANKKGPKKLKSWPLLAAQKVYKLRLRKITAVRIAASTITFPVSN